MTKQKKLREGMRNILSKDFIIYNSTHEHAPPRRDCLRDCETEDQGDGPLAIMRSGGKKHKKCGDCWNEYIDKLITRIIKKQVSQGAVLKVEREDHTRGYFTRSAEELYAFDTGYSIAQQNYESLIEKK